MWEKCLFDFSLYQSQWLFKLCSFFLLLFHNLRWSNNICHCCYSVSSDFLASTLNYPGLSVGAEMAQCSPTKRPLRASGRPPMGTHTVEHTKSLQWSWRNGSLWKMAAVGNKFDVVAHDSQTIFIFRHKCFFLQVFSSFKFYHFFLFYLQIFFFYIYFQIKLLNLLYGQTKAQQSMFDEFK